MEPSAGTHPPAPDASDEAALLCPKCGYDLRASPTDRCSECGLTIDRAALRFSAFPWVHRREIGRVRAYWQTVWQVTTGSRKLAWESSKPQRLADATRFRWITSMLVAVVFVGSAAIYLAIQGPVGFAVERGDVSGWTQDLAVPWSAGAANYVMVPAMMALLAFWISDARALFGMRGRSKEMRERAESIACYATGGFGAIPAAVGSVLALYTMIVIVWNEKGSMHDTVATIVIGLLAVAVGLVAFFSIVGPVLSVGQWVRRVRYWGLWGDVVGWGMFLGWCLLGAIILLGIVPWCLGFLWIVIDSFR